VSLVSSAVLVDVHVNPNKGYVFIIVISLFYICGFYENIVCKNFNYFIVVVGLVA